MIKNYKYPILILALLYSLSFVFWNINIDAFYWYEAVEFYKSSKMDSLSEWLGYQWKYIFPLDIAYFKMLGWLLCLSSVILVYLSFQSSKTWLKNLNYLSAGIVFMGYWTQCLYNADSLTIFLITAGITFAYRMKHLGILQLFCLSLISAAAISARFPNIIFIFVCSLYVLCRFYYDNKRLGLYVISWVLLYLMISFGFFVGIQLAIMGTNADAIPLVNRFFHGDSISMGGYIDFSHDIRSLASVYLKSIKVMILNSFALIGVYSLTTYLYKKCNESWLVYAASAFTMVIVLCSYELYRDEVQGWRIVYGGLFISLLMLAVYQKKINVLLFLLITVSGLVCAAGSDLGLLKATTLYGAFSPYCLLLFKKELDNQRVLRFYVATLMVYSVLFYYSFFLKHNKYECFSDIPECSVFMSKAQYDYFNKCVKEIRDNSTEDNALIRGFNCYMLYSITQNKPHYRFSYWQMPDDKYEMKLLLDLLVENPNMTIFDYYHTDAFKEYAESRGAQCVKDLSHLRIFKMRE